MNKRWIALLPLAGVLVAACSRIGKAWEEAVKLNPVKPAKGR